jgi:hypothetical protein
MKDFCSRAIISWIKVSIDVKPLGDRSVLEERLSKKFITVSPILIELIVLSRSPFFSLPPTGVAFPDPAAPEDFWSYWYLNYSNIR